MLTFFQVAIDSTLTLINVARWACSRLRGFCLGGREEEEEKDANSAALMAPAIDITVTMFLVSVFIICMGFSALVYKEKLDAGVLEATGLSLSKQYIRSVVTTHVGVSPGWHVSLRL